MRWDMRRFIDSVRYIFLFSTVGFLIVLMFLALWQTDLIDMGMTFGLKG